MDKDEFKKDTGTRGTTERIYLSMNEWEAT